MLWPVSYDKFKALLVGMLCLLFFVSWNTSRESSTRFFLKPLLLQHLMSRLFVSVLNRYFWCPTFSGNTLVHSRGRWRLGSAFVFNRQERIHRGEELCWKGKNSNLKRQHRDPRIKLPFPVHCMVSAFETDIHKNNSVICSVLTLLSIFYKQ